jgi:hypothetical protein
MNIQSLGRHQKSWGYEIVWASNEQYCGKILVFENVGAKSVLNISKNRKKSWFINNGRFKFTFIDIASGKTIEATLEEGKTVDIAEMSPHCVEALQPNSMIFEAGMPDDLEDQFRLSPDDTQTSSEELK